MTTHRIAAITGAASGIGQAATARLLNDGWTVYGLDINQPAAQPQYQDRFKSVKCDVSSAASVTAAFAAMGPTLNALICCAGVLRTGLMENMSIEDFDLVLNINTRGTFLSAQKALPLLRAGVTPENPSRVILLSSLAALRPKIVSGARCPIPRRPRAIAPPACPRSAASRSRTTWWT